MNERIKELAKQAGFDITPGGEIYTSRLEHLPITEDLTKFAELIVRECALQCVHNEDMDLIEKHFGVDI